MCRITTDDYLCGCLYLVSIAYCDVRACIYRNLCTGLVDECKNKTGGCSRRPTLSRNGKNRHEEGRETGTGAEERQKAAKSWIWNERHEREGAPADECEERIGSCGSAAEENGKEREKKTGRDVLDKAIRDAEEEWMGGKEGTAERDEGHGTESESEGTEQSGARGSKKVSMWWGLEAWVNDDDKPRVYAEVSQA